MEVVVQVVVLVYLQYQFVYVDVVVIVVVDVGKTAVVGPINLMVTPYGINVSRPHIGTAPIFGVFGERSL
jgi:hypothetical protein